MSYDIEARLREIAKEECRVLQWRRTLSHVAILAGVALLVLEMMVMAWTR